MPYRTERIFPVDDSSSSLAGSCRGIHKGCEQGDGPVLVRLDFKVPKVDVKAFPPGVCPRQRVQRVL